MGSLLIRDLNHDRGNGLELTVMYYLACLPKEYNRQV